MYKMKKIIALVLILLMVVTSCGKSLENATGNAQNPTVESTVPDVPNADPSDPSDGGSNDASEHEHSYVAEVTAPTCSGEGYTTYTCSECGDSYVDNRTGSLGHNYSETVTAPTCTADGYTTYTCSACGFSYVNEKVNATGHDYKSVVNAPTCENHGYTTYVCAVCNDSYVADDVNASGHGYTKAVTAPTCDEEGYTTYTCSSCNESYVADKIPALGHDYSASVTDSSCVSDGYTTYVCSVCNDSYISDIVDALGHDYKESITDPTCSSEGYTTYACSKCADSYVADKVATLEHSCNSTVTDPTCENMGYTSYVCITCDYSYISDYLDALGHSWKDATSEAPKTCTICGATEGDSLAPSTPSYSETLYVNYINVGQGDSILIKVGDCDILIDAGTASYGSTVSSYLKKQGVDDIELMINTHPDADHVGGLTQVLKDYVVEEVWMSKDTSKTTAAYKNFVSAVSSEGLTAKKPDKGTVYTYEYLTLTVLYSAVGSDSNNSSIVIMAEYGSFRFLFMGDIGEVVEPKLISSGVDLECDVLKVGHHGSKYSSTASFLSAVNAEYGVICVGSNSYGHPTSDALNRLASAGTSVYRTDKNGNVVFSTNGAVLTLPDGSTDSTGSGSGSVGGSSSGGSSSGDSTSSGSTSYDLFIGNTETKVFHLPTCSNLPAPSKQNTMYNYWWIINIAGYTPCGRCLKNYSAGTVTYIANATSKVYHVSTCSYLPSSSNRIYITSTSGYTPCGHCIN